jgi:hypothetical protein
MASPTFTPLYFLEDFISIMSFQQFDDYNVLWWVFSSFFFHLGFTKRSVDS